MRRQAWNLTGDVFSIHKGDKPWISEMYGYSFGAAKADVWHRYHTSAMIYPGKLRLVCKRRPAHVIGFQRPVHVRLQLLRPHKAGTAGKLTWISAIAGYQPSGDSLNSGSTPAE